MDDPNPLQMLPERSDQRLREHRYPVLAATDSGLSRLEFQLLHPQQHAFHQSHYRAVEQACHQPVESFHMGLFGADAVVLESDFVTNLVKKGGDLERVPADGVFSMSVADVFVRGTDNTNRYLRDCGRIRRNFRRIFLRRF